MAIKVDYINRDYDVVSSETFSENEVSMEILEIINHNMDTVSEIVGYDIETIIDF